MKQPYFVAAIIRDDAPPRAMPTGYAVRMAPEPVDPDPEVYPDSVLVGYFMSPAAGGWRRALAAAQRLCDERNAKWRDEHGLALPVPEPVVDPGPDLTDPAVAAFVAARKGVQGAEPLAAPREARPLDPIDASRAKALLDRMQMPVRSIARWTVRSESSWRQMLSGERAFPPALAAWMAELEAWVAAHQPPEKAR